MAVVWMLYLQNWLWRRYLERSVGPTLDRLALQLGLPVIRNSYGPALRLQGESALGPVSLVIHGGIRGPRVVLRTQGRRRRAALDEIADQLERWVTEGIAGTEVAEDSALAGEE